jgi:hypothetical protein
MVDVVLEAAGLPVLISAWCCSVLMAGEHVRGGNRQKNVHEWRFAGRLVLSAV